MYSMLMKRSKGGRDRDVLRLEGVHGAGEAREVREARREAKGDDLGARVVDAEYRRGEVVVADGHERAPRARAGDVLGGEHDEDRDDGEDDLELLFENQGNGADLAGKAGQDHEVRGADDGDDVAVSEGG